MQDTQNNPNFSEETIKFLKKLRDLTETYRIQELQQSKITDYLAK